MPHAVDIHVGKRIRHCRWLTGMTQQQLAEKVGLRFQQIQKYEIGANRVSASRLWDIAAALNVHVGYFFEGLPTRNGRLQPANDAHPVMDLLNDKETLDLIRFFQSIPADRRRCLLELAASLSQD